MKVLLCQDVEGLGWYGDVVDVKQGYARNYLIPQRVATVPSDDKMKSMAKEKAVRAGERELAMGKIKAAAELVNEAEVTITAKANEMGHLFGSVSEKDIAEKLREQSFEVNDKYVQLDEHIKEIGEYSVELKFGYEVTAAVKVTVVAESQDEPADESVEQTDE
ncbi:MAG: 50S ribosomal protein L9 [Anaerohalosphaeraceae bacterium]|nr:50S ribosomal protein L9 [Anaerohalosphaeraceae bacterium]